MFTNLGRAALISLTLCFGILATGCAVAPRSPAGNVGALTSSNVPATEARRGLTPVQGVVVDVAPATLSDGSAVNQQRTAAGAAGGLVGYIAAEGLKSSKAGKLLAVIIGSAAGDAVVRQAGPTVRTAEQVTVRLASGKLVGVVQEVDRTTGTLRAGEAVYVVYGPQTTRVVRQHTATAAAPMGAATN